MKTIFEIRETIANMKFRSAWDKGVNEYALELIDKLIENAKWNGLKENGYEFYGSPADKKAMLNGAYDWIGYSWGGCSLIYDSDIAERLCCPSELKKTRNGERKPNSREEWLDTQARALFQASCRICRVARAENRYE